MGSLSNLYISQSYISLLHLGSNNTASTSLTEVQDGLGNGIGIYVSTTGDFANTGNIIAGRSLTVSGSARINTAYTSSTPTYVNSGNQFTDNIIRITGSYASGSPASPTLNEVQIGWPVYGPGLVSGSLVIAKTFIPATGWQFTINQNTAVWFGNYYFTNPTTFYDNVSVSGSQDITGSLWVRDNFSVTNISASGNISASNLYVRGRISAYELDVTIESSSIIFTSGSNILGDEANIDTQTLIGRVRVSGSLEVTGSTRINGNVDTTGSLKVTSDISSSTISGIGNVTLYSTSVDSRLDLLENFSSSQYKSDSASFQSQITTNSASFAAYSSSLVATFATNAFVLANTASLSASIYFTDSSQSVNITQASASAWGAFQSASAFSASAVTTYTKLNSNNTFVGNQIISGSLRGNVLTLTPVTSSISASTVTMDCSLGNFFTLTLPTASTATINASNIQPGETVQLRVQQQSVTGSVILGSGFTLATGSIYEASNVANKSDILSFISFDTSSLYTVFVRTF
jgi:hypothetical protein